jgi:uncharacterized membrane protein
LVFVRLLSQGHPGRYDVYIFNDMPAAALPHRQQGLLVAAVERGAGMIMLGGESSFGAGGWAQTKVAGILPTEFWERALAWTGGASHISPD